MIKKYGRPALLWVMIIVFLSMFEYGWSERSLKSCLPNIAFISEENAWSSWVKERVQNMLPVYSFMVTQRIVIHRQDSFLLKNIKPVELLTMMEVENREERYIVPEKPQPPIQAEVSVEENNRVAQQDTLPMGDTQPITEAAGTVFVPHSLQRIVNVQELADFDTLMGQFYTVDSVAQVSGELLNAQRLNEKDLRIQKNTEGPQILIYHTHSQEAFTDSIPGDESTTIVGAGEHLAEILRNQYGYNVLHHKGKYDVKTRDNAYSSALPEIQKLLEENPSIQVVIDLHRDGIDESAGKLVMDLDGRPTARFMFFNGVSCGKRTGNIDYLYNPNLEENLAFSFQLKKAAEEYYPGLTRKNYINAYRYNMHLCGRTTLLELGAQNNTVEEIMNACYPIAHILDMVLSGV
ncbi:MAG: stage II sporulation protein P [Lachnospiraceae bacterium]|nr:stage II sporulation protein P [Lachnospiraceae bacterium]